MVSDNPEVFSNVNLMVIDHDIDDPDIGDETLGLVLQQDGGFTGAYMKGESIDQATIDIGQVADFISGKAYGGTQQRFTVAMKYPCVECPDVNTDGNHCANEKKCLAFTYYKDNNIGALSGGH